MSTIQTRQRTKNNAFSRPDIDPGKDLPPARVGKATAKHKVHLPGYNVRFSTFIYILCALLFAFIAFNFWRIFQWKTEAGGWWNLAMSRTPLAPMSGRGRMENRGYNPDTTWKRNLKSETERMSVESHIDALAEALGLPSKELAIAIAEAVKNYLPPASLSSISAAEATASGSAVKALLGEEDETEPGTGLKDKLSAISSFDDPVIEDSV